MGEFEYPSYHKKQTALMSNLLFELHYFFTHPIIDQQNTFSFYTLFRNKLVSPSFKKGLAVMLASASIS